MILEVETFQDIKNYPTPSDIDAIVTYGYYVIGDGGHGLYKRVVGRPTVSGYATSATGNFFVLRGSVFNIKQFGAIGDRTSHPLSEFFVSLVAAQAVYPRARSLTDEIDGIAIQTALDAQIAAQLAPTNGTIIPVKIPPGSYKLSWPLLGFNLNGNVFDYITTVIIGDGAGYAPGRRTELTLTYNDKPAIILQKNRNYNVSGFSLIGNANNLSGPDYTSLRDDDGLSPWWNINGARDNQWSPHCGIAIDPFHASNPSGNDRYPGLEEYYVSSSSIGTSVGKTDHMLIQGFIVAQANSLSAAQLGDSLHVEHCNLSYNKIGVTNGQSQNRGNTVKWCHAIALQTLVDSARYGAGGAPLPTVVGGVVSICRQVFYAGSGVQIQGGLIDNLYCESLWRLGVWGNGASGYKLKLRDCTLKLIDAVTNTDSSTFGIDTHMTCTSEVVITGGYIGFSRNSPRSWTINNSARVHFEAVTFDGVPVPKKDDFLTFNQCALRFDPSGIHYGVSRYFDSLLSNLGSGTSAARAPNGCEINEPGTFKKWVVVNSPEIVGLDASATVTVNVDGTASYAGSIAAAAKIVVGDAIVSQTTLWNGEEGQDMRSLPIGIVSGVDLGTGVVSLFKVPKSLISGIYSSLAIHRFPVIKAKSVGDVLSGSKQISNVNPASAWVVGDRIKGAAIPPGSVVTGNDGVNLMISQAATATNTGIEIYDAKLNLFYSV